MTDKPNISADAIIDQLTTSWGGDQQGMTHTWATTDIQFSLPISSPVGRFDEEDGFQPLTSNESSFARLAFKLWDDLAAIKITETTGADAPITFAYSSQTNKDGTYASIWTNSNTSTDRTIDHEQIWMNSGWETNQSDNVKLGSYGFMTYLHEIGHTLGLSHPGQYDAFDDEEPTYGDDAEYSRDTYQYTVMSYFEETFSGSGASYGAVRQLGVGFASTPMIDDIMAIQAKYGADMTTRTGSTVYGFNSNAGSVYNFGQNTSPVFSIWDAGGSDTIDASGFSDTQKIDLGSGHYSNIGGLVQNVGIAYNVTIENAVGGSGHDVMIGNAVSNNLVGGEGSNELYGLEGQDVLRGGGSRDTLDGGEGVDVMIGGSGNDTYYVDDAGGPVVNAKSHHAARIPAPEGGHIWLGDKVVEQSNAGTDMVHSTVSYTLGANLEDLTLDGLGNVKGAGNDSTNYITGNDANNILSGRGRGDRLYGQGGADTLNGGEGNDVVDGGAGVDVMRGGVGDDEYHVDDTGELVVDPGSAKGGLPPIDTWRGDKVIETANAGTDVVFSTVTYKLTDNVENLYLDGQMAINATGNSGNNIIIGNVAVNTLTGGDGDDTLDGFLGVDVMNGGTGNDVYFIDDAGELVVGRLGDFGPIPPTQVWMGDKVVEASNSGIDTVNSRVSYTLAANVENLNLIDGATITGSGNDLDNLIVGNDVDNLLDGKGGNDTLSGLGGNDVFKFTTTLSANHFVKITDFTVDSDLIRLSSSIFSSLSAGALSDDEFAIGDHAISANEHLIYNSATGDLIYDENGSAAGGETTFARLAKHLDLSHQDFMIV